MPPPAAEPAPVESLERSPAWVATVLGVAVVCAGAAYPVTAAALRVTSASVITTVRALVGIVVCLSGALGWAAAGLAMRYLSTRARPFDVIGLTTAQFLCGGVMLIPYLVLSRPTPTDWGSPKLWASLAFLVLGAQVVTYVG